MHHNNFSCHPQILLPNLERFGYETSQSEKMADKDSFDAMDYLRTRYSDVTAKDRVQFQLDKLHDLFQTFATSARLKILDYGSGPVIQHSISAAAYASEIVFCDIASSNREAIKKWLRNDSDAFNWSPHFDYVVQTLEGKGEEEAREREKLMRNVVRGVVYCDVLSENPMEPGFEGPYDVIIECGCFQAACVSIAEYKKVVQIASKLLKPGGIFVLRSADVSMVQESVVYHVGGKELSCLCITHQFVGDVLKCAGFSNVHAIFRPSDPSNTAEYNKKVGMNGYHFVWGKK